MTDTKDDTPNPTPKMKLKSLKCRRTGQVYSMAQHAECPYCYAPVETIEKGGSYENFCTYDEKKDPISFGFPPDSSRAQHG
ncbi:MAG: hypothetical protein QNJ98_11470 [Planctomycetota bacterium]|nr:hypothetical protein [Planctomycetota bacterium]